MKNKYYLIPLLVAFFWFYTEQVQHVVGLLLFYLLGFAGVKLICKKASSDNLTIPVYNLFFFIYGLLTILSQIILIKDPYKDYYVHNDAALSFFASLMEYGIPSKWEFLADRTLLNPMYADYPLAAYLFGAIAKLGEDVGIIDLRLFLREHVFTMAAMIPAFIANISYQYNVDNRKTKHNVLLFGLVSYLFITSAIFSRDLHICFVYTLGAYVFLLPTCRYRLLYFIILLFLATGFRPLNGVVFIFYILMYYNTRSNNIAINRFLMIFLAVVAIAIVFNGDVMNYGMDRLATYENNAKGATGGIFAMIYGLPFPLNQIGMDVYMLLMPLPYNKYIGGEGGTLLNLSFNLSPFLMLMTFAVCLYYLFNRKERSTKTYQCLLCSLIVFFLITMGSPDLRRCFAAVPGVYMIYCIVQDSVPIYFKRNIQKIGFSLIIFINIMILMLMR